MVSEAGEIIARLVAGGANYQTIGEALGRNRSLIRQVAIGAKPGRNLRDSVAELERRVQAAGRAPASREPVATPPPRRTTVKHGREVLANVRKPTTIRGRSWTASTAKRAATRSGARGLGHPLADAAESGRQVAVTVSVDGQVSVEAYGSSRRGRAGVRGSADFKLGDADEVWESVREDYGGNVTAYVAAAMVDQGLVSGMGAGALADHITEIDLRAF
jgi:hypothetical protein